MSNNDVLNLIQCPMCNKEWILDNTDLVCAGCSSALNVDLAVLSLGNAISQLEEEAPEMVRPRLKILLSLRGKLTSLLEKAV